MGRRRMLRWPAASPRLGSHADKTMSSFNAPEMDYAALSPVIALTAGLCVVLLCGVFDAVRRAVPALTMVALAATAGLLIWQWGDSADLVSGALRLDDLAI